MIIPFRGLLFLFALLMGAFTSYSVFAEEIYDRLDGKGPSHKRVDVIEWEGNLELHVYPKGSLKGMSAKLDDRVEGKKVMIVGYRFSAKDHLIRRAILGIPFDAKLKGFIDRSEKDFDKLAVSNQNLPAPWTSYKLDPAPAQWYPDGDDRNEATDPAQAPYLGEMKKTEAGRVPAAEEGLNSPSTNEDPAEAPKPKARAPVTPSKAPPVDSDEQSLNRYNW